MIWELPLFPAIMKRIDIKDLKEGQIVYEFISNTIGFVKCKITENARRVEDHEIYNDGDDLGPGWVCFCEDGVRLYVADGFEHMGPKLYTEIPEEYLKPFSYIKKQTPKQLDDKLKKYLNFIDKDIVIVEGFSEAFLGITEGPNGIVAVYSMDKITKILMERKSMSYDEALEYIEHNLNNVYMADKAPLFLDLVSENQWNC